MGYPQHTVWQASTAPITAISAMKTEVRRANMIETTWSVEVKTLSEATDQWTLL